MKVLAPILLLAACGDPADLRVQLGAPNGFEGFYQDDEVRILWNAFGEELTCDLEARGVTTIVIETGVVPTSSNPQTTLWVPAGVDMGVYTVAVTCNGATDESDAGFYILPPPQAVSFSGQLQPVLTATCLGGPCHPATNPQANLDLTDGAAYADLVDAPSTQCAQKLVEPGAPQDSYLIQKMVGSNAYGCYFGDLMPKVDQPLQTDVLQLFRDWIKNGAPNN